MKTAVVICPGRGTYNAPDLGYLGRAGLPADLMEDFERRRADHGQTSLGDLDSADRYDPDRHATGDNAAALIFACTAADVMALRDVEIVAVTGNSMGWYSALAVGGALDWTKGFDLVNSMGALMHDRATGGQIVYPWMGDDWRAATDRKAALLATVAAIRDLHLSIDLGGMLVLAGAEPALAAFETAVPKIGDRFPMRLRHHGAFHSPLMTPISEHALTAVMPDGWSQPRTPLVDGRGHTWWPGATDLGALRAYTLGHQITEPYDFTNALRTAAREFAPDLFIVPGPGTTLGGSVAQALITDGWMGMRDRATFETVQAEAAPLVSMARADQRSRVT